MVEHGQIGSNCSRSENSKLSRLGSSLGLQAFHQSALDVTDEMALLVLQLGTNKVASMRWSAVSQREADRLDQFQQRKRAEELTNGMAIRNAALEQLAHKSKKKRSSWSLHKLQATKRRLGLPNVLNKNISIPLTLCYYVSLASKRPRPSKRKSQKFVKSASATQTAVHRDQKGAS